MKTDPATYDAWYGSAFGSFCHALEKDALFSLARFKPGEKALDAGCGTGVYLEELLRMGLDVTGVDEDVDMLGYAAKNRARDAGLVRAALLKLPFEASSFDKVVTVCTLEFISEPTQVLKELSRVLKKNGVLLLGFLNRNSPWARLRMKKGEDPASVWHGARFYGLPDVGRLADKAGLRMLGVKCAVHFPPEAEGKGTGELEDMESSGRRSSPSSAAFIAVAFGKSPA